MNKFDKATDSKNIRIICIVAFIIVATICMVLKAGAKQPSAEKPVEIGYLVAVSVPRDNSIHKTTDIAHVNAILHRHFKSTLNASDYFGDGNYFEIRNLKHRFYVEKKRVVRKRNGKIKFRKLKNYGRQDYKRGRPEASSQQRTNYRHDKQCSRQSKYC